MSFYSPLDGAVVASYPWDHYTVNDYNEVDDGDEPGDQYGDYEQENYVVDDH